MIITKVRQHLKTSLLIAGLCATILSPALLLSPQTYAVDVNAQLCEDARKLDPGNLPLVCKDVSSDANPIYGPDGILTKVMNVLAKVIGAAAVVGIIISGARLVFSGGDTNSVTTARTALIYCLVGLAVAVLAQAIVSFVLSKL